MYCPRCGHQPVANELRFCSYCGFKLGVVKASLAEEEEANRSAAVNAQSVAMAQSVPLGQPGAIAQPLVMGQIGAMDQPGAIAPSHRNTSIGVILMSLAPVLTLLLSDRPGPGLH